MKCGDCKFWSRGEDAWDADAGECHRRAPAPVSEAAQVILGTIRDRGVAVVPPDNHPEGLKVTGGDMWDRRALWPTTLEKDFCGEFIPAKTSQGFV